MPDQRQAAHERNLLDIRALRGDDDAANYDGTPSATVTLVSADWVFRAGIPKRGNTVTSAYSPPALHEHRAFGRDLRVTSSFSTASMNCTRDRVIDPSSESES